MHAKTQPFLHCRSASQAINGPILYACTLSDVGLVLVGRSADGICCILLGDCEDALQQQLAVLFAPTECRFAASQLAEELEIIRSAINQGVVPTGLRLDLGGTPFQQRVWQALCAIPAGQTRSYKDIATVLHQPGAVRAVATACAANVIAAIVPCHRVIRQDGSLSGYRWGIERKRALLASELPV